MPDANTSAGRKSSKPEQSPPLDPSSAQQLGTACGAVRRMRNRLQKSMRVEQRPRILCVDDEVNIRQSLIRVLRPRFDVVTAESGAAGLEALKKDRSFVVIVSDMRMPGMRGTEFLRQARLVTPDTVRVLLTAHADFNVAIDAINAGNVFRFLAKPCSPVLLLKTMEVAVEQYRLITADRNLLEEKLAATASELVRAERLATHRHLREWGGARVGGRCNGFRWCPHTDLCRDRSLVSALAFHRRRTAKLPKHFGLHS